MFLQKILKQDAKGDLNKLEDNSPNMLIIFDLNNKYIAYNKEILL